MGIAYFPEIYPDELIYSVLARYYVHSGYVSNLSCFRDVYMKGSIRADIEFMNQITYEIRNQIKKSASWEQIIWQNTMYPYYSRFIDAQKGKEAWTAMIEMDNEEVVSQPRFNRILSLPHSMDNNFYLKYCPICVKKDRELYGETYWHRRHQIRGLGICFEHGCRLIDSTISLMSYNCGSVFNCAELVIGKTDSRKAAGNNELRDFASYVIEILEQDNFAPYDETVKMLYEKSKMLYAYGRYKAVDLVALNEDFQAWKQSLGLELGISEVWQVSKLLRGYRRNPYEVCQVAFFLKADADDMAHPSMESIVISFDDRVSELVKEEKELSDVAEEAGVSIPTVKSICEEKELYRNRKQEVADRKKKQRIAEERIYWLTLIKKYPDMSYNALCLIKEHRKHLNYLRRNDKAWTDEHWFQGCKKRGATRDWKQFDEDTFSKVKDIIATMKDGRPQAINLYSVAKRIGISSMTIKTHLPKCRDEIKLNMITQNELYARKLLWAVNKIQGEGEYPSWKQVRMLTNMSKENVLACMPYLKEKAEPEVYELVQAIL